MFPPIRTFLLLLFLSIVRLSSAQDITIVPLFRFACQLDSNCALYARLGIQSQVDSVYEKKKFSYISRREYDEHGQMIKWVYVSMADPDFQECAVYRYNDEGMCIYVHFSNIRSGDTMAITSKQILYDDTVTGKYAYELKYYTRAQHESDSLDNDLELRYVDTEARRTFGVLYPDRILMEGIYYGVDAPLDITGHVFHSQDTLFIFRMYDEGLGSFRHVDMMYNLDAGVRSARMYKAGRLTETKTWVQGKFIEHHRYVDSLIGLKVVKTEIFNVLDSSEKPEVIILRTDSLTTVTKGDQRPFIEYSQPAVYADSAVHKEPPEFPQFADFFSYHQEFKLENGNLRTDYFNPFSGSALPLFRIWEDERGVAYRLEEPGLIIKRSVK